MDPLTRLAHQARAGDQRAVESFVNAAYEQVWRLCASLVDGPSAEDLAQETFERAIRALPQFRGESTAQAWLLTIARRTCMDELRARTRRRRRDASLDLGASRGWPMAADASEEPAVADLLARLETEKRTAFVLTQVIGLSYHEAAAVCDCRPGTISSRVARARADLLQLLENPDGAAPARRVAGGS